MTAPRFVDIAYRRLPDRETVFRQEVIDESPDRVVTLLRAADLPRPVEVGDRTVLEPGAPVVWFTYPGRWYDIGRFHLADHTFTGFYANILTPVELSTARWATTDLFLDVWRGADGASCVLDRDEFDRARAAGWMDAKTAAAAEAAAADLLARARDGTWPDPDVLAWSLDRALAISRRATPGWTAGR